VRPPALKGTRALFQAADGVVAIEEGAIGEAFAWIDALGDAIVDDRGAILVEAGFSVSPSAFSAKVEGVLPDVD